MPLEGGLFPPLRLDDPRFNALINPPADNTLMAPLGVPRPDASNALLDMVRMLRPDAPALQDRIERSRRGEIGRLMPSRDEIGEAVGLFGGPAAITRIPNPIRAYHGSPHRFEGPFRLDRIGTGEGTMQEGYGLNFAGWEREARFYRDTYGWGPNFANELADMRSRVANLTERWGREPGNRQLLGRMLADAERDLRFTLQHGGSGHMYEVDLHLTPEQILAPGRRAPRTLEEASRLSDEGIHGLAYRSRMENLPPGADRYNYVVWSPEVIEILRRYGLLGPTVGAAGAAGLLGNRE